MTRGTGTGSFRLLMYGLILASATAQFALVPVMPVYAHRLGLSGFQQGLVLGVEAIEGTDALLRRCAGLRREGSGGVLVKVEKPGQETRIDRPTVGPQTVRLAAEAGLVGIAVEAGSTLMIDRDRFIREADAAGLFVIGIRVG